MWITWQCSRTLRRILEGGLSWHPGGIVNDGAADHRGDASTLFFLKSATNMKMDRLIVHAAADRLTGSTPGSFVLDACGLVVRATSVRAAQFRTREVTGTRHACRRTVATCVVLGTRTASSTLWPSPSTTRDSSCLGGSPRPWSPAHCSVGGLGAWPCSRWSARRNFCAADARKKKPLRSTVVHLLDAWRQGFPNGFGCVLFP